MENDFPSAGQVFDYHYLWKWQADAGETEGRKKRPACMALVVVNTNGQHVLFIAPMTSKRPDAERHAVVIPEIEARRARLDTNIPLWVLVDELNADVLEASYTLEDRIPRGRFSDAFTDTILTSIQNLRKAGVLMVSSRT